MSPERTLCFSQYKELAQKLRQAVQMIVINKMVVGGSESLDSSDISNGIFDYWNDHKQQFPIPEILKDFNALPKVVA